MAQPRGSLLELVDRQQQEGAERAGGSTLARRPHTDPGLCWVCRNPLIPPVVNCPFDLQSPSIS